MRACKGTVNQIRCIMLLVAAIKIMLNDIVLQAAESYRASVRKQEIDSSQLDVADHILTAIGQLV